MDGEETIIPVVLVHGWRSSPAIWDDLLPHLQEREIPAWNFNHAHLKHASLAEIASELKTYATGMRHQTGYSGPVDIICHSMGSLVARYAIEIRENSHEKGSIRQLIGIGPPNNGSVLAELFNDPVIGSDIIEKLKGTFVPRSFDPHRDLIVQDVRPGSRAMRELQSAGTRSDVIYRVLISANLTECRAFFPCFEGRTWEIGQSGKWQMTFSGDGIIPHSDAILPGRGYDILPTRRDMLEISPERYCHLFLPTNPEVITKVLDYIDAPDRQPRFNAIRKEHGKGSQSSAF